MRSVSDMKVEFQSLYHAALQTTYSRISCSQLLFQAMRSSCFCWHPWKIIEAEKMIMHNNDAANFLHLWWCIIACWWYRFWKWVFWQEFQKGVDLLHRTSFLNEGRKSSQSLLKAKAYVENCWNENQFSEFWNSVHILVVRSNLPRCVVLISNEFSPSLFMFQGENFRGIKCQKNANT